MHCQVRRTIDAVADSITVQAIGFMSNLILDYELRLCYIALACPHPEGGACEIVPPSRTCVRGARRMRTGRCALMLRDAAQRISVCAIRAPACALRGFSA